MRLTLLFVGILASTAAVGQAPAPVSKSVPAEAMERTAPAPAAAPPPGGIAVAPYTNLELFHQSDYFYDSEDKILKREPSVQVKAQIGTTFQHGSLDLYGTIGAIKLPGTQKMVQRRPEVELDFYPLRLKDASIAIYNRVELPFSDADYDKENAVVSRQGSIYTLGTTPHVQQIVDAGDVHLLFSLTADMWSSFFSRRQFVANGDLSREEDKQFFLTRTDEGEPVEAAAPPFQNEYSAGLGIYPLIFRAMVLEAVVVSTHKHVPVYYVAEDSSVSYKYRTERRSHYRIGLIYQVSKSLSLSNDFYHYHEGFFEERTAGTDDGRFRNTFKVTCRL